MPVQNESLIHWLQHASTEDAQRTALLAASGIYEYATLYARLGRLASRYAAAGLASGEPTAIVSSHTECIAWGSYLAMYRGCPVLPLDPEHTDPAHLLKACGITQLIADTGVKAALPSRRRYFASEWLTEPADDPPLSPSPVAAVAVQLFVATSGVSAKPRAVMLTGENLAASVHASRKQIALEPDAVWLNCLPLVHIGGFMILLRCAYAGATVLLHEGFDASRVWVDLIEREVTHISLVPAMLARLLDHCSDQPPPTRLRRVLIGGSALSATLAKRARDAGWPLIVTYGMSETASHVTLCDLDGNWAPGHVGKPVPEARIEIVDETGNPTGGTGRIQIGGPMVMVGYANAEGACGIGVSNAAYMSDDLGCVGDDGQLHVAGRADDILISGGKNIHPQDVEEKLLTCPGVQDVAVTARHDDIWGDVLVALFVGSAAANDINNWCSHNMASSLRPREIVKVSSLPRNRLGKLKRQALARLIPAERAN
ncbi:MAG: class I adenylate-forming enzyme family protein [Acidiferrobacterales bacterium]